MAWLLRYNEIKVQRKCWMNKRMCGKCGVSFSIGWDVICLPRRLAHWNADGIRGRELELVHWTTSLLNTQWGDVNLRIYSCKFTYLVEVRGTIQILQIRQNHRSRLYTECGCETPFQAREQSSSGKNLARPSACVISLSKQTETREGPQDDIACKVAKLFSHPDGCFLRFLWVVKWIAECN
jgi:hypothetical protein